MLKVSIIGTGYVGLVSGTCFSEMGHHVTCIDIDAKKIATLKMGQSPIYEPGLTDMLERNIKHNRLHFSDKFNVVEQTSIIFLAVGTPSDENGRADLKYLMSATSSIAPYLKDESVVVIKSTVPIGTHKILKEHLSTLTKVKFHIVNNPEFLKEGAAIDDFMKPDRVVIGHDDEYAAKVMSELYEPLMRQGNPIYMMSNLSAEMTKYAANCFLATKISFINEIARLCDLTGADVEEVRQGITSDKRIGPHFLYPGPGYGGSCFPKDVKALISTAQDFGMTLQVVQAAEDTNTIQKSYIVTKVVKHFGENLKGKTIALWGVAFKPNTDDIRETAAITVTENLLSLGAKVIFYDPIAADNFKELAKQKEWNIQNSPSAYECIDGADAVILLTEWAEFRMPDLELMQQKMKSRVVFDTRNIFKTSKMKEHGFHYYAIGKKI